MPLLTSIPPEVAAQAHTVLWVAEPSGDSTKLAVNGLTLGVFAREHLDRFLTALVQAEGVEAFWLLDRAPDVPEARRRVLAAAKDADAGRGTTADRCLTGLPGVILAVRVGWE